MPPLVPVDEKLETVKEDDRVSVHEVDVVEGPPAATEVKADIVVEPTTEFEKKTANELKELLTQKGIPFGKRDAKSVLVKLLQATA
jgi:hypothetical protein